MNSQPQNLNPRDTSQNHKQKRSMDKLKRAVLGAMTQDSTTPLSEEAKKYIEKRLLQLFPVIRTPDHPPYAWMILDAIKTLKKKKGSSEESLSEYIQSNYQVPWAHSSYLSHHLCKLAQIGEIVVTSDNHYMIPTENPKPKIKNKKRKSREGGGCHGHHHKEAVVEEKNQLGEQEIVEIEELSQAQERENFVIDEAKEQDYQMSEGKDQSKGQQNEVRSELLTSCLNDELSEEQNHENCVIDEAKEEDCQVNEGKNQSQGQQSGARSELLTSGLNNELSEEQNHENCVTDEAKEQDCQVNEGTNQSQGQQSDAGSELLTASLDDVALMVIPVESSSLRVEEEEEEKEIGEELQKQPKRRKMPVDAFPPLSQNHLEKQEPQSQHQGGASIPEENTDTGSLLPLGSLQYTPPQQRGRGRPPKARPDTITRGESLMPLQKEFYERNPPMKRGRPPRPKPGAEITNGNKREAEFTNGNVGRKRPPKPKPHAEITTPTRNKPDAEADITNGNIRRGRPPKRKPDAEITTANVRRGRPPKPKPNPESTIGSFSTSDNPRRGTRIRIIRRPHFDTTTENSYPLITDSSNKNIHVGEGLLNRD